MNKRILSLVLALVMVLGTFGTVFAAEFEDVTGSEFESAVERLDLLGILEGYPDGTFKPAETITRAEFAAVAVRAKGLADAANASKGLATGFTDVATDYWAAGFITTAGKLGVVNGVGNGQFAPLAPVKYEEAVTMIVRALGYEPAAQTKGGYPYGYLIVANEIGLLDQVKGTQGQPASRGIVAQITDNALEIAKMIQVGFGSDSKWVVSGSKEHGTGAEAQYLLHDLGVDEIKGYVTNNFRTKSTVKSDEVEIKEFGGSTAKYDIVEGVDTDAVLGTGVTAWAKDDVVFSISIGFKAKQDGKDFVFDEEQVLYDAIVADDTNDAEAYLYKLDDEYDWADNDFDDAVIYVNNVKVDDVTEVPDKAYGRFVLNEDDEIEFAYLFDIVPADTGLVTEIDATDLEYVNLNASDDVLALDDAEEIYVFNKNLSAASLDDIKENTSVFYWIDADDNYYIIASNDTVEGTLEAVRVRDSRITVEGTGVKFEQGKAIYSLDDKEDFNVLEDFEDMEDYVDEEVIVYLNLVGDTLALVTDTEATTSKIYGIATWLTSQRNPVLSVYTQEGKEVEYTFEETNRITSAFKNLFNNGEPTDVIAVEFKVNKDGEIKDEPFDYEIAENDFVKDDNKKYGKYGTENLYITEDTVILKAFNSTGKLKPSIIKYENIINKEVKLDNAAVVILDKGNDLALLVFTENAFQATDDTEYGIITSDPTVRGTSYKAEIDVYGKGKETYNLSSAANNKKLRTGDLISFELNDKGEVVNVNEVKFRTARDNASAYHVVDSRDNNFITTKDGVTFRRTSDTVIYSATKAGGLGTSTSFSRLAKDSVILLIEDVEGDKELKVILDITAYVDGVTPEALLEKAVAAAKTAQDAYVAAEGSLGATAYTELVAALAATPQVKDTIIAKTNALKVATETLVGLNAEAKAVKAVKDAVDENDKAKFIAALDNELFENYVPANNNAYWTVKAAIAAPATTALMDAQLELVNDDVVADAPVDTLHAAVTKSEFIAALKNPAFTKYVANNDNAYWAARVAISTPATVALIEAQLVIVNNAQVAMDSFTAVTLTQTGTVTDGDVQYQTAAAVIAALPTEIEVTLVNGSKVMVPITWADTDSYDAAADDSYVFTATWGTIPSGANNDASIVAPTVTVVVAQ